MKQKSKRFGSNFAKVDATPGIPDDEIPEITKEMLDRATLSIGGIVVRGPRKRGRPAGSGRKQPVHIMLDRDIVSHFRSTGRGWQTRINDTLSSIISRSAFIVPGIGEYSLGEKSTRRKAELEKRPVRGKVLSAKKGKNARAIRSARAG